MLLNKCECTHMTVYYYTLLFIYYTLTKLLYIAFDLVQPLYIYRSYCHVTCLIMILVSRVVQVFEVNIVSLTLESLFYWLHIAEKHKCYSMVFKLWQLTLFSSSVCYVCNILQYTIQSMSNTEIILTVSMLLFQDFFNITFKLIIRFYTIIK